MALAGMVGLLALAQTTGVAAQPVHANARSFSNCTAMHRVYPHGVGKLHAHDHTSSGNPVTNFYRNNALYYANSGLDRDKDYVACEAH
jgi:hypothetical protein